MTFKLLLLGIILTSNTDPVRSILYMDGISRPAIRKVATIIAPPLIYERTSEDGNVTYEGFIPDLLADVTRRTGINFSIVSMGKGKFGENANETWDSMTQLIRDGEAYVGAGPVPKIKHPVGLHFTAAVAEHKGWSVLIRKPDRPPVNYFQKALTLFQPFRAEVWLSILSTFIIVAFLLTVNNLINPYEFRCLYKKDKVAEKDAGLFGPFGSVLFAFSTLTWQGYEKVPRSNSAKTLVMFWVAFVAVTLVAYIANLTAYLMAEAHRPVDRMPLPIKNVRDIIADKIKFGTIMGWPTLESMASSDNDTVVELAEVLQKRGEHVNSFAEGVEKLKSSGDYALILDYVVAETIIKSHCSIMSIANIPSNITGYAFVTPKGQRQKFDKALTDAKGDRTLLKLKRKWLILDDFCDPEPDPSVLSPVYFSAIDIYQYVGPLCIVGTGIVLFFVVCIAELIIHFLSSRCFGRHDEVRMVALRDEAQSDTIDCIRYEEKQELTAEPPGIKSHRSPADWVRSVTIVAAGNDSKDEVRRLRDELQDIPDIDDDLAIH